MEPKNPTMLESSGEDAMLIETVKSIVTQRERNESETEDDFFLVSQDQDERYSGENVDEMTSHKHETKEILAWVHFCRTCANACDNLIPIFEDEGVEHDLPSKILKYLPIHISKSDTLPLKLCHHCAGTLLAWHELSEGCLSAEKKLLKMQETLENKQQYYPASLDNLEVSTLVTTITPSTVSNTTNSQPDQQIGVKNREHGVEEINKSNRWTCQVSNEEARYVGDNSQRNYEFNTEILSINIDKVQPTISSKKYLSLTHLDDLKIKILESQNDHLADSYLDNSETRQKLQENRTLDSRDNMGQCEQISEHKYAKLTRSKITKNNCTSYKCKECGKILSTSYNLLIHCNIHTGARPYNCSICDKSFRSASNMRRHMREVHDGVKKFVCDVCGRCFASRASRDEHRRIHTGERPHTCEICGKSFKQKASLHVHRLYHSQVLPHHCDLCDRGFRRKQELDKHVSWHSDQKPYICTICNERFRSKSCVVRHQRIHTDQWSHNCTICSARFTQQRYLKKHCERFHKIVHT
ncbi:zinc finger protein 184-like isoform X3 [Camponotus floridanus]|nr:zinc finger protein 184-like isoform X3 [Camponotus floridanus]